VQADRIKGYLSRAASQIASWSFDRVASLAVEPWVEEVGAPCDIQFDAYCQIEAELLDRISEDGIEALHVTITAGDCVRVFGTDLFVYRSGRVRRNPKMYEYLNGIPVECS
jgi:hypothetical protein